MFLQVRILTKINKKLRKNKFNNRVRTQTNLSQHHFLAHNNKEKNHRQTHYLMLIKLNYSKRLKPSKNKIKNNKRFK